MKIIIENLKKVYDGKTVLDIEQFEIKRGSLCGIIGPNGAGKSTLIKLIAGLEKASCGDVFYGKKPKNMPPYEIMTLVFQKPYLLRTTVFNNIAYPLQIRNYPRNEIESRTNRLLKDIGLYEFRNQKAWKLSGGETQKVALARALSFKPKLLLLDEFTSNVDPLSMAVIEKMIKKINAEEKTTVITITHNLQQAKRLCSDIMMMHNGKVIEANEANKLLYECENKRTKAFVEGQLLI